MQAQTVSCDFKKIYKMHDKLYCGLAGLATDVQSLASTLDFRLKLYKLEEERDMKPSTFSGLLCTLLYERRFAPWFIEPVVAGLDKDDKPFISAMDLVGAPVFTDDFVVSGTSTENMYGMCESLYRKDMVRSGVGCLGVRCSATPHTFVLLFHLFAALFVVCVRLLRLFCRPEPGRAV